MLAKANDLNGHVVNGSRELEREGLIQHIAQLTQRLDEILETPSTGYAPATRQMLYINARMWLRKQNARYKFLPKNIFRDPAWNILIDTYVQEREGRAVSTTSACAASGAPNSTALRWIASLEDSGLIARIMDTMDGRRTFIRLTPKARVAIEAWLLEPH